MADDLTGIDYETYSDVDLKKHNLDRYVHGKDFTPLIASVESQALGTLTFDFIVEPSRSFELFENVLTDATTWGGYLVAHNAGFERAVLQHMGLGRFCSYIIDSAVIARINGAASSLEASLPQLTSRKKLETGANLIQKFCIPNEWNGGKPPTRDLVRGTKDWADFAVYCEADAAGSRELAELYPPSTFSTGTEIEYELLTQAQNEHGWRVDMSLVREMQQRYNDNVDAAIAHFRVTHDPLNELPSTFFNSTPQLKAWCAERGVKAASFDADHVLKLGRALEKKLAGMDGTEPKYQGYVEVAAMVECKRLLGGSSLKKLQTIIDTVGPGYRLRGQYMHAGAGQTYRTTGRGVQMQNLKRLGSDILDMDSLYDESVELDNDTLGENLRQVFTASDHQGLLIVGDFGSVESRALAWLAEEEWKLDSYRQGKDIYKVLASKFSGVPYDEITKEMRSEGKYSELSCGYQSGPQVLKDFMYRLGFEIPLSGKGGATERVNNWREANPKIVDLWARIDETFRKAVMDPDNLEGYSVKLGYNLFLVFKPARTPASLKALHPGATSITMQLLYGSPTTIVLERVFHGCYMRGRDVGYYKPSDTKKGPLWKNHTKDPKTDEVIWNKLYGGKITGILTQSFCRELFFYSLSHLHQLLKGAPNAHSVGQFHDEIVVDWVPAGNASMGLSLDETKSRMEMAMTTVPPWAKGFPLTVDVKEGYRYIK